MLLLPNVDQEALKLGMIQAFCEMVQQGVKPLAFSPPMEVAEWQGLQAFAEQIADHFQVKSHIEWQLVSSDLATDEAVKGKVVVLYYLDDQTLVHYLAIKAEVERLQQAGLFTADARRQSSKALRRLLGYPEAAGQERG